MKINIEYLKNFVAFDLEGRALKELLAGIGLETEEALEVDGQTVLDLETTPNRPDWLSHYGIAREIAAKDGRSRFTPIDLSGVELIPNQDGFSIQIENPSDCWRYSGCIVRDLRVKESPPEVQKLLVSLGLRPISDIVDISNLVMMTCGQPLHIFDLDRLQGGQVRVRRARRGETLRLLDGRDVALDGNHLLIADASRPLALAGIMGGLDSGITAETRHIFIESACFDSVVIRRGARSLGLKTDASYRFERGMDVQATVPAIKMALQLLARSQGGPLLPSFFQDAYPRPRIPADIRLDKDYPGRLTGIDIPEQTSAAILGRLGFTLRDQGGHWLVTPPSHRVDAECKQDLVEEIIRIHGYGHLRGEVPLAANLELRIDRKRDVVRRLKNQLIDFGFNEVINYVFQAPEENLMADPGGKPLFLKNPLGKDFSVMKNSLLAGLLKNTAANANQSLEQVALFEIGNVFSQEKGRVTESQRLAVSACGLRQKKDWRLVGEVFDFAGFKSLLTALGRRLRLELGFRTAAHPVFAGDSCFVVLANDRECGVAGEVAPGFSRFYKLERPVFAAEIDLEALVAEAGESRFRPWRRYPSVRRDFTFLMPTAVRYEQLAETIERLRPETLESYELTDVFRGASVPKDKVSFSMAFIYRVAERTLTHDEVNEIHREFAGKLAGKLHLIQR
ncbi:MAG: phenylalanine--tRNA ligase subunit beta [Candidatus Aminicenantes bacterium]|nr:phenylalanine--tRNA ligase subunit beta [Candidatus Aminicenantes bacterium]